MESAPISQDGPELQTNGHTTKRQEMIKLHNAKVQKQHELIEAGGDEGRTIKRPDFSHQYPASYKSVKELEKITLNALRPDTHHYGKCLIVRTVALPHTGVGTTTIVEDDTGAVERLVIFAYSDSSILSNVPEGCFVAIKEPFFRTSSKEENEGEPDQPPGAFISIDHPSDIVLLRFSDPAIAARFGSVTPLLGSADEWKQAGDASFLQGDLATAAFCYTEALDFASTTANNNTTTTTAVDRQGILAKRAGTHLLLGRFDAARADALESLTEGDGGPSDWRAHQTAAKASYALGEFATALAHLESGLRLNPTSAALIKDRDRARARVAEEETGVYDFGGLAATLSPGPGGRRCTLDVGNFTRRTEERRSATHGRGLFATERIRAGELVFVEKATVMPPQYDEERSSAALYAGVVRRMLDSPTLARRLCGMFAGDYAHATGREGHVVDGVAVVDVFHAELVRVKNCFSAPLTTAASLGPDVSRQPPQARGMWPLAAAMNHACVASTARAFVGDVFITRALRDIAEGEELTQQYIPVRADVRARQGQYGQWWGFECGCVLCAAEKGLESGEGGGMVTRRRLLLKQIEKMVDRSATTVEMSGAVDVFGKGKADNGTVRNVERVMGLLEGAHEVHVYGPNVVFADVDGGVDDGCKDTSPLLLPRLLLIFPNMWLMDAYRGRRKHAKVVQMASKLLRNFGFVSFPGSEGTTMHDFFERQPRGNAGIMTIHLVRALMCATEALRHLGRADEAADWEAAARFAFKIMTGWENNPAVMLGSS
ncbi:hypothetical protein MCOR25_007992 [Pyricularia grisea]|uniref:SET domain-containing protein n=1 Tax=Pyricularia grisea TaxID=148305 RepID=A0A6P8B8N7_PYRGI|nr:uncharacterized protein PgNI_05081 [Pyricularia grisea]KAI6356038.1 hypothetical protein MCOR25_007992 [Pyricularia grisea]TLD12205.1 hypothetical protein PgNI_05081 [Pyricularia grisea]